MRYTDRDFREVLGLLAEAAESVADDLERMESEAERYEPADLDNARDLQRRIDHALARFGEGGR